MTRKLLKLFLFSILCSATSFGQSCGVLMKPLSIQERVDNATKVIEGEIISSKSYWDLQRHDIYTVHEVKVYKKIKGDASKITRIVTTGGQVDDEIEVSSSAAKLDVGTTGVFFLKSFNKTITGFSSLYSLVGAAQGAVCYDKLNTDEAADVFNKYQSIQKELLPAIEKGAATKFQTIQLRPISMNRIAVNSTTPSISSFSPETVSAGTKTKLTITGSNFGTTKGTVSFPNSNTGGASYVAANSNSEIISWSDTQIEVEVPTLAGTGRVRVTPVGNQPVNSSSDLTITFNHAGIVTDSAALPSILQDDDGNGGYTFQYHTDFNTSPAKAYLEQAFEIWNCESDINFKFGDTTTVDVTADDGINIIRFDNGNELGLGVLGNVKTRFLGSCANTNRLIVRELDITFDDSVNWYYGDGNPGSNQHDFKSVALHELGHAHQLGHIINPGAVMHYTISRGQNTYGLSQGDIDGAAHTMGLFRQTVGCGVAPMTEKYICCDDIVILTETFPRNGNAAENGNTSFEITAQDYETIQWQVSTDNGSTWIDLTNNTNYSGITGLSLNINNIPASFDGNKYRAVLNNLCDTPITSSEVTLNVIQYTDILDDNFEAQLGALGYDDIPGDNKVPTNNINTITSLNVDSSGIGNMAGIEAFTALEELYAFGNPFTAINLQNNLALKILDLAETSLESIDISANTALVQLILEDITTLNPATVDISNNNLLEEVDLARMNISNVIIGNNDNLKRLYLNGNLLTSLDVSDLNALETLRLHSNNLSSLNVKNGNNNNVLTVFSAQNNPNLNCILVDNEVYSTNIWTQIDAQTVFSDTSCGYTAIPDTAFEAALGTLGYDDMPNDGQVPTWLIDGVTTLDVESSGISDLKGIEGFAALVNLNCSGNTIEELNMQGNLLLEELNCNNNVITDLNVQSNQALRILSCENNSFSSLNVLNNENLEVLDIESNNGSIQSVDVSGNPLLRSLVVKFIPGFNQLDVSNNPDLEILLCNNTSIPSLDLSNNNKLTNVQAHNNNSLTSIDVTGAVDLEQLLVRNTQVSSLNVSDCAALTEIDARDIRITALNLGANGLLETVNVSHNDDLTSLHVRNGNNEAITSFNATNVPNLSCIGVDDVAYSTANWTNIDTGITFDDFCEYTAIPDINFEAQLGGLGLDDIPNDGQVPTVLIANRETLFLINKNINDLTGIEDFTALETLRAERNNLQVLDVSHNHSLKTLNVSRNDLETLVLGDIALEILLAFENQLTELDFTQNTALRTVSVRDNQLTNFNIKNGNNTNITAFFATGNANLTCITVDDAAYSTTNWTNIDAQTSFREGPCYTQIPDAAFEARLNSLDYDDIAGDGQVPTALIEVVTNLDLEGASISNLSGLEDFTALTSLNVSNSDFALTTLDVSHNTNLVTLIADESNFDTLILGTNTNYETILINGNQLEEFEFLNLTNLKTFNIGGNPITELDVSTFSALETFICNHTDLFSLNIKNNNNEAIIDFQATNNSNLTCIRVDDVAYSTVYWDDIDAQTEFTEGNYCRYTQIPDTAFESTLENLGYDDISGDGQVPTVLIETVTTLNLDNRNISNLSGINDFTALQVFRARSNPFTDIDISDNENLTDIDLFEVNIDSLNVDNLMHLKSLALSNNSMRTINLSENTLLETLLIQSCTQFEAINLSQNTELKSLSIWGNALERIDLQGNTKLTSVVVAQNQITSIDFSTNTLLEEVYVQENPIQLLNVGMLPNLIALNAKDCNLISLNIKNNNNENIASFDTTGNPNLTCIAVDDAAYSTATWANVDAQTTFTDNYCRYTAIPDSNFELELETLGYDDISGDGQVPTALIENVTILNLVVYPISNLAGIEGFAALENLRLTEQTIDTVNLTANTQLKSIFISDSSIGTIDISNNPLIEEINATNNGINAIVLPADLSNLTEVSLTFNNLESLDLSAATALDDLFVNDNNLNYLNIKNGNNQNMGGYNTQNNPNLTCVLVDDAVYATTNFTAVDAHTSFREISCCDPIPTTISCPADITAECPQAVTFATPTFTIECEVAEGAPAAIDGFTILGTFGNSTYFISDATDTAENHFDFANTNNYKIVTISSAEENSYIRNKADSLGIGNLLIGYNDLTIEDTFEWQSGEPFTYDNWRSNEPSDSGDGEDYTWLIGGGRWNDTSATSTSHVLLEFVDYGNGPVQVSGLPSGSFFPIGVTTNTFIIADIYGTVASCSFDITITDTQAPSIVCSDIIVANDPGTCGANITIPPPSVTDTCGNNIIVTTGIVPYKFREGGHIDTPSIIKDVTNTQEPSISLEITFQGDHRFGYQRFKLSGPDGSLVLGSTGNCELTTRTIDIDQARWNGWINTFGTDLTFTLEGDEDIRETACGLPANNYYEIKVLSSGDLELTNDYDGRLDISGFYPIGTTVVTWTVTDQGGNIATCTQNITVNDTDNSCTTEIALAAKVLLQGAAINPNTGEESLMRDDLRAASLLPTTSPYADGLTCDAAVFDVAGSNAIVDWILVELRDATDSSIVSYSRSALIQRDGDVVDVDGTSVLNFSTVENTYYITVKHRNHLGIRSANTITFSTVENNSIDFTNDTSLIEGGSNAVIDLGSSRYAMFAGDEDANSQIQNTDINTVITVLGASGYSDADMDMNGQIQNTDINNIMNPNVGKGEQF
ncbi:matrixin family metalloprotease [Tenacibaculum agarivorans]|uniref:matrixin family metalloprotease n=1 Tax=Tenacibaculum agarivorans TaxID=1908389 RepID=UPI00094B83E4|nr:matrixin family metalloprotease [Tenacibaculum agarivorans]